MPDPDLMPVVVTAINGKLRDDRVFNPCGALGDRQRVRVLGLADFDETYQGQMQHSIELILKPAAIERPQRAAPTTRVALLNLVEAVLQPRDRGLAVGSR